MANSLRAKLKKLNYEGKITDEELNELLDKLDGHDRELIKHGHWECISPERLFFQCSNCYSFSHYQSRFCSHCGSKMVDEEVENGETNIV